MVTTWGEEDGVVTLPDGRRVRATALRRPRGTVPAPDLAVHLLGRPSRFDAWPVVWIPWRDFGLPRSTAEAGAALRSAHERSATGRVEVGCGGGVGRTGCALAALAVLSGLDPADAVGWVRRAHHPRAVETPWQRRWVERAAYLG